ncbi:MAG: hypothetical protein JXR83_02005 [Deltaproteobacteria bacterium]|nr:hypothetical protein [Deltaproteobacteria bacterium]
MTAPADLRQRDGGADAALPVSKDNKGHWQAIAGRLWTSVSVGAWHRAGELAQQLIDEMRAARVI